jgi:Ca-activated chloride channel family protein
VLILRRCLGWGEQPVAHIRFESALFTLVIFSLQVSPTGLLSQSQPIPRSILARELASTSPKASRGSHLASFRVSSDLVLVPVTVTDRLNRPQTDLRPEDFIVYEGQKAQKIQYFSSEDSPISVGLLVDASQSMTNKFDTERAAVAEFFKNANPEDDYFVVTFNYGPRVLSDVTRSTSGIETELGLVKPSGSTALLDAIYLGIDKLQHAQYSRRALVIISDGGDNSSRYKLREVKNLVAESDVMVYAIGIFDSGPFKSFEEKMGKLWLSSITDVSGGRTITVTNAYKLPEAGAQISRELRSQYVLGYHPAEKTVSARWRKIKVAVPRSSESGPLRPYYKKGYYASEP